ncbi:DUF3491 domain-containing protein [Salmonella enterica subsp. salamae]|nr:DUF3491 domain-containing protein [Salmonella enterica subsp. salamae]
MKIPTILVRKNTQHIFNNKDHATEEYTPVASRIKQNDSVTITPEKPQLNLYNILINKNLTTEEVVFVGEMLQKAIYQREEAPQYTYMPLNHSGNWKKSTLYNLLLTISSVFQNPLSFRTGNISPDTGHVAHAVTREKSSFQNSTVSNPKHHLPDVQFTHKRVRRAGENEEPESSLRGEKRPAETDGEVSAAKVAVPDKPFRFSKISKNIWIQADQQIFERIFPDFDLKFDAFRNDIYQGRTISQTYFNDFEKQLLELYQTVTSQQAKQEIYTLLCEVSQAVRRTGNTHLILQHLPQDPALPPAKIVHFPPLQTHAWPDQDRRLMLLENIDNQINRLRADISNPQATISQNRFSDIESRLLTLYHKLTSLQAKQNIYSLLSELHQTIKLTGRTGLILKELPPEPILPLASNFTPVKTRLWPGDDVRILNEIFPDFRDKLKSLRKSLRHQQNISQNRVTDIENRLLTLHRTLTSPQAIQDITILLNELHQAIRYEGGSRLTLQQIPQIPQIPQAQQFSPVRVNLWTIKDTRELNNIFPDFHNKINALENNLRSNQNISQSRITDIENRLLALYQVLTSPQAMQEIYTLLSELHQAVRQTGDTSLTLQQLPQISALTAKRVVHFPPIQTHTWPEKDRKLLVMENIDTSVNDLRADILNPQATISQSRLTDIESRLLRLYQTLTSQQAKQDIDTLLNELRQAIQHEGRSHLILQQHPPRAPLEEAVPRKAAPLQEAVPRKAAPLQEAVPRKAAPLQEAVPEKVAPLQEAVPMKVAPPSSPWLMTDFRERNINMDDSWSPHDRRVQKTSAPHLQNELRRLAEKNNPTLADITRLDNMLSQMLALFTGDNARATVQSIRETMLQYFRDVSVPVTKHTHLLLNGPHELVATLPLHSLQSGGESLTIWTDISHLQDISLKNILGKAVRLVLLNDKLDSIQSVDVPHVGSETLGPKHIPLLQSYRHLMTQTPRPQEALKPILEQIKQIPELLNYIKSVEASIPLLTQKELVKRAEAWGELKKPHQKDNFQRYVNKFENQSLSQLAQQHLRRISMFSTGIAGLPEHVMLRELSSAFRDTSLYYHLSRNHYIFNDRLTLVHFLLIAEGQQGLFTHTLQPVLSAEVTTLTEEYLGAENAHTPEVLKSLVQTLETHLSQPRTPLTFQHQPALSQIPPSALQMLALLLEQIPTERWFQHPDWGIPLLGAGIRFSTDGRQLTDTAIMAGPNPLQTASDNFCFYLDTLYYFHQRAMEGKLTTERVQQKLQSLGMTTQYTPEQVTRFVSKMEKNPYQSLTAIHRHLTNNPTSSLAHAALLWSTERYPLLKNLVPASSPEGHILAPSMVIPESLLGIKASQPRPSTGESIRQGSSSAHADTSARSETEKVVEPEKYNLLFWEDFYHSHVALWDTAVRQHQGYDIDYNPQSLMMSKQGRCLGLSLIYLEAGENLEQFRTIQKNLMTANALSQTKYRDGLPLSAHDENFLRKVETLLGFTQRIGNQNLAQAGLKTLPLSDSNELAIALSRHKVSSFLITTETHSLALQAMGSSWRVIEPNFGYTSFTTLAQALTFIHNMVEMPAFRQLYGTSPAQVHFSPDSQAWLKLRLPPGQTSVLNRLPHHTTHEQLATQPESVRVGELSVTKAFLHEIGATFNKVRIGASTHFNSPDMQLKLNGDILRHYLNTHMMSQETAQQIRTILETVGLQSGTQKVKPEQIFQTPSIEIPFHVRLQQQKQHVKLILLDVVQRLDLQLQKKGLSLGSLMDRIDHFLFADENLDIVQMRVTDKKGQPHTVSVDIPELGLTFREGLDSLAEGVDIMNLDAVMSFIGLVQYGRLMAVGAQVSALDHAGAVMDVKNLIDKALGGILRLVGSKVYNPGISGARLEVLLATRLEAMAARIGGSAGRYLSGVAKVIRLPLIDIGINIWAMYTSVQAYTDATSYSDRLVAAVDISFAAVTTGLSLASMAYPPLAIAIVPITLFAHDVRTFVSYVAQIKERHDQWLQAERFLYNGARNVLNAIPEEGILDLSNNQVLGQVVLDLRVSPPHLSGFASFNSGKNYGSRPGWTDRRVMEDRAYNWVCTNPEEAGLPSFGGEYRDICNAAEVTPDQMARGYANRQWPDSLPVIPQGQYHTVLLGYGETLRANTEVVRMDNGDFRETARAYNEEETPEPLLSVVSQSSQVYGGDRPLTVVVPVADKMLLGSHLHMIDHYKDYRFNLVGGKGGITVQIGGIGHYDIIGFPGAKNVLSYLQMPRDFNLELDLSRETVQKTHFRHPSGFFDGTVMTLRQRGINTVVGTAEGYDRITGNDEDNTFYLGSGGGTVHSGGGNNVYILPGSVEARCHIYLSPSSQSHHIHFNGNIVQFGDATIHRTDTREFLFLSFYGKEEKGLMLEGDNGARLSDFTDRMSIYTKDGVELRWSGEPATLQTVRVNISAWEKEHPGVNLPDPKTVLALLPPLFSMRDPCTLEWPEYQVIITPPMWNYLLSAPAQQISLPDAPAVSVLGASGSRYVINPEGSSSVTLLLKGDNASPETVDLSRLTTRRPVPEVRLGFHKEISRITLTNKEGDVLQQIILRNSDQTSGHIHHSQTLIRFSPGEKKTLAMLHRMVSHGGDEISLRVTDELTAERVVDLGKQGEIVAYLPGGSGTGGDRALCLENNSGMKRILHGQVVAGVLKSIQGAAKHASINKLGIQPYSRVYLGFEEGSPVLIQGAVTTAPLLLQGQDSGILAENIWQALNEIVVLPGEHAPSVALQNFVQWKSSSVSKDVMDEIRYQHDAVRIQNKDLMLTFFSQQTKSEAGVHRLLLKEFFIQDMGSATGQADTQELSGVIPANPAPLINPAYKSGFSLTLGNRRIDILSLLSLYYRIQKTPNILLELDHDNNFIPLYGASRQKLFTFRLTPQTAKMHMKFLRITLKPEQFYYINAQGDLLLTRLRHFSQAIIIILEGYRDNWWQYDMSLASSSRIVGYKQEVIEFKPTGIQITAYRDNGKQELYHYPVPESHKLYCHHPLEQHALGSESEYRLWELWQRELHTDFALTQDLRVEQIATVSGNWEITPSMLRHFPGYYHTEVPDWPLGWLKAGDSVSTPLSEAVSIYLTTGNANIFEKKRNGFQLYYRIDGLQGAEFTGNEHGDSRCTLWPDTTLRVTGVDETLHFRRVILITLSSAKHSGSPYYSTPEGASLF